MGSDPGDGRSRSPRAHAAALRGACLKGVLPFGVGLLLILLLFRSPPPGLRSRRLGEGGAVHRPLAALDCPPAAPCDCAAGQAAAAAAPLQPGDAAPRGRAQLVGLREPQKNVSLPDIFLFVGVLSGRGYRHRRLAVREAWANAGTLRGEAVVNFILSEDERTAQVAKEVAAHGDIAFLQEKTNYKSILYKTYFVLEYAVTHYDARFVLKTDDDAFINVRPLLQQLRLLCVGPDCRGERIYMGKMAKESEVLLQPGHKWNNAVFFNHTGLRTYPNYMMGGGYLVSGDVAHMLATVHHRMQLKFTPIEDATMGFWLAAMDLRHIDHARFYTWAAPCCFKAPVRREGQRIVTRFQLQDDMENDLCSDDPWLVLHKIDSPTKMRYIGSRVQACNFSREATKVAPSIARYVQQKAVEEAKLDGKPEAVSVT